MIATRPLPKAGALAVVAGVVMIAGARGARGDAIIYADPWGPVFTWNGGGGDNLFATGGNWLGGVPPAGAVNGQIIFGAEGGGGDFTITNQDAALTGITGMSFTAADGAYTISGVGSFAFASGAVLSNDSLFTQTINVDLIATGIALNVVAASSDFVLGGAIDISDTGGTQLSVSGGFSTTISGVISGANGSLLKFGSGTLTLTGNNTYTGGTTLLGGLLILGHDNALGTGTLNVTGFGTIQSDNNVRNVANAVAIDLALSVTGTNDLELSGVISGIGGLLKKDTGTLRLSGVNTYLGTTDIQGGIVQLVGGFAIADTAGVNLADAAGVELELLADETIGTLTGGGALGGGVNLNGNKLTLAGATSATHSGVIRGTGSLELTGTGAVVLAGANTYSGGTVVSGAGATLGIGSDTALGTGTLSITANATLTPVNGNRTVANNITINTNSLTLSGSSTLDFTGAVDLSTLTTTLDVTNTAGVTFSGVISNGALTKIGAGTLTLSGINTYLGDTTVNAGELILNGSIAGSALVGGTGRLSGGGSILGNLRNQSGGSVGPGNGIGILRVLGNYDQLAGSTLSVELNGQGGTADRLDVTGTATLAAGSTIGVTIASPTFIAAGDTFTIITATGGIFDGGAFIDTSSVTLSFLLERENDFLNGDLQYVLEAVRTPDAFSRAAIGDNNQAVGRALDSLIGIARADRTGEVGVLLGTLDMLGSDSFNQALLELSPERHNTVATIGISSATDFTAIQARYLALRRRGLDAPATLAAMAAGSLASIVEDPRVMASALAAQDEEDALNRWSRKRLGAYARGFAFTTDQDTDGDRTGFDTDAYGGQLGIDFAIGSGLVAGLAVGHLQSDGDLNDGLGDIDTTSIRGGPYFSFVDGPLFVDVSVTYGSNEYEVTREMPTIGFEAKGDYDGTDLIGFAEVGVEFEIDNTWTLMPSVSLQYGLFEYDGFTETGGAGANLIVDDRDVDSLRSRISVSLVHFSTSGDYFEVSAGWQQEFLENDPVRATFVGGGDSFRVDTGDRDDGRLVLGTGLAFVLDEQGSAFFRYEGTFSTETDLHSVSAGVSFAF